MRGSHLREHPVATVVVAALLVLAALAFVLAHVGGGHGLTRLF